MPRDPRAQLDLPVSIELYRRIRRLWIRHSIAEDRRDLDGLIATLSADCVYEIPATGERWDGHAGARRFYTELLTTIPDVHFDLTDLAIGPQGVIEVARVTGTGTGRWAGIEGDHLPIDVVVTIAFPWDAAAERFAGERIFVAGSPTISDRRPASTPGSTDPAITAHSASGWTIACGCNGSASKH